MNSGTGSESFPASEPAFSSFNSFSFPFGFILIEMQKRHFDALRALPRCSDGTSRVACNKLCGPDLKRVNGEIGRALVRVGVL